MVFRYSQNAEKLRSSAIRELSHIIHQPGVISFAGGSPAPESFPVEALIKANRQVLTEKGADALQYNSTEGLDELRKIILSEMEADGIKNLDLDNILITNGAQQGLDFCGRIFLDPGSVVICEDPSYLGALNAFACFGCTFVGVGMDQEGMSKEGLEQALRDNPEARFIYLIPTYQNPTGMVMSQRRRQELLAISLRYQVPIIEDDPYSNLHLSGEKERSLKSYDQNNNVIYLGTFSKTFCPGLRIGWLLGPADFIRKAVLTKQSTDLHTSSLSQMELASFIKSTDWEGHKALVRRIYKTKRDLMLGLMEECFPKTVKFTRPQGGLFIWVKLPEELDAKEVLSESVQRKVAFVPGSPFYADGGHHNTLRLSYGMASEREIEKGIRSLGEVLKAVCP